MTDEQIIELYWQRDESAISETNSKYGAYCRTVADHILHSAEDSEECVNHAWLRAWNVMPPQRPRALKLFLAKITRNLAFDRFKAQSAKKRGGSETDLILSELEQCIADGTDVEEDYIAKELGAAINQFVSSLPTKERHLFIRRYFFAESVSEIAKKYAMTNNYVSVKLSRIRKKLKNISPRRVISHDK